MSKPQQLTAEKLGLVHVPDQRIPTVHTGNLDLAGLGKLKIDVISDQAVTLDHAKALEYLDLPVFPGEREITDAHVQTLYDEMRKGTFNSLLVVLSSALLDGARFKINGQHTCWAVVNMPASFSLKVREIKYRVNSREQLKLLYGTYDRLRARSDSHMTKVFLADSPLTADLWMSEVPRGVNAFRHWHMSDPNKRNRTSPDQLAAVIQGEFADLFRTVMLFKQTFGAENAFARRIPVMAAMFATFFKLPTKASEFWQPVIDGLGLTAKTDPRYVLRDTLQHAVSGGSGRGRPSTRLMSVEDQYRVCLLAWNKWRKGETVRVALRVPIERPKPQ